MAETIFGKPYTDKGELREFDISIAEEEEVWHRDKEDRECEILEGDGWCFQYENCLPWALQPGMIFHIMGSEFHRLIKGKNTLKVRLIKYDKSYSS